MIDKTYSLLANLGITANYLGFYYTWYAVSLALTDMENLVLVTKRLYPEIAKYYRTSAQSVERNIRTVVDVAWKNNPNLLMDLANRKLLSKPTVTEFLAILTTSLLFGPNGAPSELPVKLSV